MADYREISVESGRNGLTVIVYPQSSNARIFEENDLSSCESRWQLVEGEEYEYEFTQNGYFFKEHELVNPSKSNASRGLIKTGVYVGCLTLKVVDAARNEIGEVEFEVRSVKVDYRTDYKTMLHDITRHFTELVMMQGAPVYKHVDLLKMHAYKDAIRRTSGAYIIYLGTEHKKLKGFHEILPGLGAFCLNPNSVETDSKELELFLHDIVEHMLNRTSQREKMAYHTYETYKNEPFVVRESLPEPYGSNRDLIPEETFVLLGSYKDENHLQWILNNGIYNLRTGTKNGSVHLKQEITTANLNVMGTEDEFKDVKWDIKQMISDGVLGKGRSSAEPRGISMVELMKYVIHNPL